MLRKAAGLALLGVLSLTAAVAQSQVECEQNDELRQPFFGDVHVHTRYSLDASTQGTRTTPDQAYRFAQGEALGIQPWSASGEPQRQLQLSRPLDFAMVSDHAELLGEVHLCNNEGEEGYGSWQCRLYRWWPRGAYYLFNYTASMRATRLGFCGKDGELCREAAITPWQDTQAAAANHNDNSSDCRFTTFVGYEWTGLVSGSGGNLHRNVVFRNATVPRLPASFIETPAAPELWSSLLQECLAGETGCEAIVIPHNSNLSAGAMFSGLGDGGSPMTADYARRRMFFEPLVEVMQHKGASECYFQQGLSEDELCAFEALPEDNIAGYNNPPQPDTGFVREALLQGMALQQTIGVNPYQFGMVASTDTHLGAPGAVAEDGFPGHGGAGTPAAEELPPGLPDKLEYNPGGLMVVWAEQNRRDSLFDAMRRRETSATSGPRIASRLFAGWDLPADLCERDDAVAVADRLGVAMGGELPPASNAGAAPAILVLAAQDPGTADSPGMGLQRLQIIKGWVDASGNTQEQVIDVAGNPDNGASVDLNTCETAGEGSAQLCALWRDPDFNAQHPAFYYARAVENPSCRWSQRQCVAAGVRCDSPDTIGDGFEACCTDSHRPVIQERAWTSPVWYTPAQKSPEPVRALEMP